MRGPHQLQVYRVAGVPLGPGGKQHQRRLWIIRCQHHISAVIGGEILHLGGTDESLQRIWPQVRANNVFSIRVRHGIIGQGRNGQLRVGGYSENAVMEWAVADNLPNLYRQVRLAGIYEMLAACGLVNAKTYEIIPER